MNKLYSRLAAAFFVVASLFLMLLALTILIIAAWEVVEGILDGRKIDAVLNGVGLLVIGFAVIETAKFIAEEEIMRKRELRSSTESRQSITKFVTIIVIATSLEALVMIFQANRENVTHAIYPAALFMAAMFALVALGLYQWLSSRIQRADDPVLMNATERPPGE